MENLFGNLQTKSKAAGVKQIRDRRFRSIILDSGMNANAKTSEGTTALIFAARDLEKVRLLVERGADVNARAATGVTALIVAARHRGNLLQKVPAVAPGNRPLPRTVHTRQDRRDGKRGID